MPLSQASPFIGSEPFLARVCAISFEGVYAPIGVTKW